MAKDPLDEYRRFQRQMGDIYGDSSFSRLARGLVENEPFAEAARRASEISLAVQGVIGPRELTLMQDAISPPYLREIEKAVSQLNSYSAVTDVLRHDENLHRALEQQRQITRSLTESGLLRKSIDAVSTLRESGVLERIGAVSAAMSDAMSTGTIMEMARALDTGRLREVADLARMYLETGPDEIEGEGDRAEGEENVDAEHDADDLRQAVALMRKQLDELQVQVAAEKITWRDVLTVVGFVLTVIAFLNSSYTDADRARDQTSNQILRKNQESLERLEGYAKALDEEARNAAETQRISGLPKAVSLRKANIRETPEGSGKRIAVLDPNSPLAIEAKLGRWVLVNFRDPLTNQLDVGWVWYKSMELLD